MKVRRAVCVFCGLLAVGCQSAEDPWTPARLAQNLVGVPQDGYPNYQERLMLVAINRGRSDPNRVDLQTAAQCSAQASAQPPLMHNHNGARAARFHCLNLLRTNSGLSHKSYCTLRSDIATTNCDGSAACACQPGTENFNCTTLGGQGTDPWTRTGYFGYGANGEVGAAGYGDGWSSVIGWITECPPSDGHRNILTGGNIGQIGLGYAALSGGCWRDYSFGDTASGGTRYLLPAGIHQPESGGASTEFTFRVNLYSSSGAHQSLYLVLDGHCLDMTLEAGQPENGTYLSRATPGSGCHSYYFLSRDSSGVRRTYPEEGSFGVGSCTDYQAEQPEADCETCTEGEKKPCGLGKCAGQKTCQAGEFGPCDGPEPDPAESCNGIDDDCDGVVPANEADADSDGVRACAGDCDDNDPARSPGATESCNGKDDDCDGVVPATEIDADSDGVRACAGDCDDNDPARHPGATESCNGIDDDCDGTTDPGCACSPGESRACGVGQCAGRQVCSPQGQWGSCDGKSPDPAETCHDNIDNDCDGATDEECGCREGDTRPCDLGECAGAQACDGQGNWGPCQGSCGDPDDVLIQGGCGCGGSAGTPPLGLVAFWLALFARRIRRKDE